MKIVHKGEIEKRVQESELDSYLSDGWLTGYSDSHRKKLGQSHLGHSPWNKGVAWSEEVRDKISATLVGNIPWNKGLTGDDERVRKYAESANRTKLERYGTAGRCFGHECSEQTKRRISKSNAGRSKTKLTSEAMQQKQKKEYLTRKKNGTFNTSRLESAFYFDLCEQYDSDDIVRQYRDERYPFQCDFYIKSEDLFIEVHGNWTHGGMPYDESNSECVEKLKTWQEKAKTSDYYKNAIYTWTDLDVRKVEIAKENNLNIKFIYYKRKYKYQE